MSTRTHFQPWHLPSNLHLPVVPHLSSVRRFFSSSASAVDILSCDRRGFHESKESESGEDSGHLVGC